MQDWYLMTPDTRPNATGGYENEGFLDWKEDSFYETLETDIATTVVLYNYDLSKSRKIRCIIQGNTADTQLKSMERTVLVPIGSLKAGDYLFYENEYWLVNGRPGNNQIYEKAVIIECQYLLKWQNNNGDIIERWINLTSASKYDVGENGNHVVVLTSNNYTILIPNDIESFDLDGKRVFIDLHPTNPTRVFKITRTDDPLYNYNSHGGILNLIADKVELNKDTDNQELRICDYIEQTTPPLSPDNETSLSTAVIRGKKELKCGFQRSYIADLSDSNGNVVDWDDSKYKWNVLSDFNVEQNISANTITLYTDNEEFIGSSFLLQIIYLPDTSVLAETKVSIVEGF